MDLVGKGFVVGVLGSILSHRQQTNLCRARFFLPSSQILATVGWSLRSRYFWDDWASAHCRLLARLNWLPLCCFYLAGTSVIRMWCVRKHRKASTIADDDDDPFARWLPPWRCGHDSHPFLMANSVRIICGLLTYVMSEFLLGTYSCMYWFKLAWLLLNVSLPGLCGRCWCYCGSWSW
jgi:hypothetical protein